MLIGYARVSTNDQETATQVAALKAAACERTYREKASRSIRYPVRLGSGGRWTEIHIGLTTVRP
jgi:DNA invertase Pin-like site-specific DNA recombinase